MNKMITFTKRYETTDGNVYKTIKEAQIRELEVVMSTAVGNSGPLPPNLLAEFIIDHKTIIIDILTTTQNSKPKARSINGGSKKRTPKVVITDANASINSTVNT